MSLQLHLACHALDFHAHHAFCDWLLGIFLQERIEHAVSADVALGVFQFARHVVADGLAEGVLVAAVNAEGLDEGFVHFRQLQRFYFFYGGGELRGFTGEVGAVIVGREGDVKGFFFACLAAANARFKIGQHSAVADDEVHVFAAAAVECDAVQFADEIDGDAVGVFRRLVRFMEGALLTAQGGDHVVHVFVVHFATRQGDADLIQSVDGNFRHYFKNGGVFDRLVGSHAGDELDLR